MKKRTALQKVTAVLLVVLLALSSAPAALAAGGLPGGVLAGWESWEADSYPTGNDIYNEILYPQEGATVADILYFTTKIITENEGILNARYGGMENGEASIFLVFDAPNLGADALQTCNALAEYFNSYRFYYGDTPVYIYLWHNLESAQRRGITPQVAISLTNDDELPLEDYRYISATDVYEQTTFTFYNALNDILEYTLFGKRSGTWVQNSFELYSWGIFQLRGVYIEQSEFEIIDIKDFNMALLQQPYTSIDADSATGMNYVLVEQISLIATETASCEALYALCEAAKAASDTQRGQLKYINDYLCRNVAYDDDYAEWLMSKESEKKVITYNGEGGVLPTHVYGTLIDELAVCTGFSHTMAEACNYLGIPNCYVETDTHVWNAVYLDGAWKMIDVTWNATGGSTSRYFLVDNIAEKSGAHD